MTFLWLKALHVIAMVAWFAGLFYLPRLFVYHSESDDEISINRFKIMERRLYYAITMPSALITTLFGGWMLALEPGYYFTQGWMHAKLTLVILLWIYHIMCGYYLKQFAEDKNKKSSFFYRIFNEIPTVFLVTIVILVIVKP